MCGRYAVTTAPEAIRRLFGIAGPTPNFAARYNAAPGLELPVVRRHPQRGESVKTTPAFRDAYAARRCLVPADAFYEWKAAGKIKQPYAIARRDRAPFALAGLWENWKEPASGEWVRTFSIVTTKPNELVAPLHDRMPLILP